MENIKKIIELSEFIVKKMVEDKDTWYKGHKTYLKGLENEIEEVKSELKENNSVYLEDELGDILWTYIGLLHSLEQEGKIKIENVFERSNKKYSKRIYNIKKDLKKHKGVWEKTKKQQKKELLKEHNEKYGK